MNWDNTPLPHRIGPYRIVGRLGRGGMGEVYIARSPGGMKVAVKVIRPQRADDAEFRRRFAREVQAARQVNSAYTAAVVNADAEADEPWLATVHVAGVSLDQALRQHGPWPASSVRALGAGLVEALSAIHAAGVVHRDLKPSNVILTSNGPRVIDFGISAVAGATTMTAPGAFVGTPGFASPEQIQDQPIGPASDIFSLGVLLAHTATGHNPFGRHTTDPSVIFYRTMHEPPTLDGLLADLHAVIAPCLAKDPAARPTPAALLQRLVDPTDDMVTVLGTDAWLPGPVAELAALRGAEHTSATPRATTRHATAPAIEQVTPALAPTAVATVRDDTPELGRAGASMNGDGANPAVHQADTAPAASSPSVSPRGHRTKRTHRRWLLPGLPAALALTLLASAGWWWTQREDDHGTPGASAGSTTSSSTPSAVATTPSTIPSSPAAHQSTSGGSPSAPTRQSPAAGQPANGGASAAVSASASYFAGAPHCRQQIPVDKSGTQHAKINPCISIDSNNQVIIWSDYTAEETGTFTVFIWLADAANADPVTSIYTRCPVTFTHVGQHQTTPCKKSGITPPQPGKWIASMVVEPGTPQTPSLWNTNYKGTQSGGVTWGE
ncbi:serine/threonine-protein kinase [Streptomyces sp. NPDC059582]|uniref:serine/threonine-protein kinase n=1 Tax=Streptomyces sp. NPDC059582 TaxID=3346875 RepID=UPI0036BEC16F